jgi:hypothetical protein
LGDINYHEATKFFRNCNELLFPEMDTWRVRLWAKIKISNYGVNQLSHN